MEDTKETITGIVDTISNVKDGRYERDSKGKRVDSEKQKGLDSGKGRDDQ